MFYGIITILQASLRCVGYPAGVLEQIVAFCPLFNKYTPVAITAPFPSHSPADILFAVNKTLPFVLEEADPLPLLSLFPPVP